MIINVNELIEKTKEYLYSINFGNKDKDYAPTGSLAVGGSVGKVDKNVKIPRPTAYMCKTSDGENYHSPGRYSQSHFDNVSGVTKSISFFLSTSENIDAALKAKTTKHDLENDFLDFTNTYLLKLINNSKVISGYKLGIYFILLTYFINAHFFLIKDYIGSNSVFLYKKGNVNYKIPDAFLNLLTETVDDAYIVNILDFMYTALSTTQNVKYLKVSSTSSASSSSSSCSSSCSSSSCSSSSSSSGFIMYLKL